MRYCLAVSLCFIAVPAQAEPFEVWEDSGAIWARDLAGGDPWKINRNVNAHSPDVDGPLAVWIEDWSYSADVMGNKLNSDFGAFAVAVQAEIASDPQVGFLKLPDEWAYVAWRQSGGIWAVRMRDFSPPPAEVVPNYTGPFDLTGRTLTWDGGSVDLHFPTVVPEPGVWAMLLGAAVLFGLRHSRRYH